VLPASKVTVVIVGSGMARREHIPPIDHFGRGNQGGVCDTVLVRTETDPRCIFLLSGCRAPIMIRVAMMALAMVLAAGLAGAAGEIETRVRDHLDRAAAGGLRPDDFHHLVFAFFWRDTLPDATIVERGLDRLAAGPKLDPLMADELRLLRARMALEAGRTAAAQELFRSMGGLTRWWAQGPIGIDELADFDDLARPPSDDDWRPAAGVDGLGWVRLSGLGWPAQRQLLFLATTVECEREQAVAIRVGAAQAARVWLNGREVVTTPRPLDRAEDQVSAGSWLRQGRNTLMAAVASENDDWWLRVRLTAPDGSALDGVRESNANPMPIRPIDRAPPEVRDLETEIRRSVASGEEGAAMAMAAYLVLRRPHAAGTGEARSACRMARVEGAGEARLLEWLISTDQQRVHELLRDAVAADPGLTWARLELASWYADRGLFDEARTVLEPVADEPAATALALDIDTELWGLVTLPELVELARTVPSCETVNTIAAHRALDARRPDLAVEVVARLEATLPAAPSVVKLRERLAEACGDRDALLQLFSEGLEFDPNDSTLLLRLARLLGGVGDVDGARTRLEAGLARSPTDVDLMMELARVEHTAGADERAIQLSREVLLLRPQEQRARGLLELLGGEAEDLGWLRPVDELWRIAADAPDGDPAVTVLDHVEVHFLPSQLTEERVQRAILVTAAERADRYRRQSLPYVSETQRLRVLAARVLRRDGTELSARQGDTPRLAEPEFNLFYDTRLRVLDFPELEDGDLIEVSYLLTETIESNETGPYNGGLIDLGRPIPTARAEVELVGPEQRLPHWELINLDGEPQRLTDPDGSIRLRWTWSDLPGLPHDVPPSPPLVGGRFLAYSSHPTWTELGSWYSRHIAPRVRSSRQVEETAERLTAGVRDRLEKIARIYTFVTNEILYVGLEFGEHRFRPFSADWVLNHRIGDCKDKAALLVALFDALDIPVRMVMVRTADLGPVAGSLAQLEVFNHAIAYLPDDDLWLDGTASGHALLPPPAIDQQATVFVVGDEVDRPQVTPSPGAGLAQTALVFGRSVDGRVPLSFRSENWGEAADRRRSQFAGSQDSRRFAAWLQRWFAGAELTAEPVLRLIPSRDPAVVELEAEVPSIALVSRGGIATYPGGFDWPTEVVPTGVRSGPLLVEVRPDLEWTLEVDLGGPPEDLPDSVRLDGDYGSLRLDIAATDTGYRVSGFVHLEPGLISADQALELRGFLLEVKRHLDHPLEAP
jgi:transglutaminase-like putative cysteine protease